MVYLDGLPKFDISNEAWREYLYSDGKVLRVGRAAERLLDVVAEGLDQSSIMLSA